MIVMGLSELAVRLPAAIFFSAAVFVTYNTISKEMSREIALGSSILLVVGNSAIASYRITQRPPLWL